MTGMALRVALGLALGLGLAQASEAADARVKAVASFSILGDMVKAVGGDRVNAVSYTHLTLPTILLV